MNTGNENKIVYKSINLNLVSILFVHVGKIAAIVLIGVRIIYVIVFLLKLYSQIRGYLFIPGYLFGVLIENLFGLFY